MMVDEHKLEPFWQAARDQQPEPSPEFLARVLADGLQMQAQHLRPGAPGAADVAWTGGLFGLISVLRDAARNWLPMGGMVAATCTGVIIGLSSGNPLSYVGLKTISTAEATTVELLPTGDLFSVAAQVASESGAY
ncbi:hypothetical protein [Thioclava sp. GXIMD4215]|uniref:hypothetical protein n=1 Tax=Thioclava sp. GXIMD4215 TaxID=3131928 RepID=UPI0032514C15